MVDFEIEQGETEKTRALFERLLERTKHVKVRCVFAVSRSFNYRAQVWISYAKFAGDVSAEEARKIFERADEFLKGHGLKEEVRCEL